MNAKSSAVALVLALTACTSKVPQTSQPAATTHATAALASVTPPPVVTVAATVAPLPKIAVVKHADKLALKRIVLARGVEHHEPVDPATSFDAKTQKVFAFVEIENPEKLPGEITVEFEPPSKKDTGRVSLAVGDSSRWRTWAFTRQAHEAGEWTAIVRDEHGHVIGRQAFDVTL